MTIASTNVSLSTIAAEKGIGNANLSLATLSGKEVKNTVSTGASTSTFGLQFTDETYGGLGSQRNAADTVVTSAQGSGPAGLNTAPFALSEWVGYNPVGFGRYGHNGTPVADVLKFRSTHTCRNVVIAHMSCYCYLTNTNQIVIACGTWPQGSSAFGTARLYKHDSGNVTLNANGTQAIKHSPQVSNGVGKRITGCTMSYTTGTNSAGGDFLGSGAAVSTVTGGATSTTNLGSTKIGYNMTVGGTAERVQGSGPSSAEFRLGVRFNWIFENSPAGVAYEDSYTEIWCHLEAESIFTGSGPGC